VISTPSLDWLALGPTLALLVAAAAALLASVLVPEFLRRGTAAVIAFAGFVAAGILGGWLYTEASTAQTVVAGSMSRDRWGALAAIILAGAGALAVLVSWGERRADHAGEYYALLAAAGAGMVFFVTASNLLTLFLGLEWFSSAHMM